MSIRTGRESWYGKVALVAFAKNPEEVLVKTRLARSLGEAQATAVYVALLDDCLSSMSSVSGAIGYLACFPDEASAFFQELGAKHGLKLVRQEGRDLGERMLNVARELLGCYQAVLIFGTDVPVLPVETIETVLDGMKYWDVVLGPTLDGGYYAFGASRVAESMFSGVEWGSKTVLVETVESCVKSGLEVAFMDVLDDIDDMEALERLTTTLGSNRSGAEKTRKVLAEIGLLTSVV